MDNEFIELLNVSNERLNLRGITFTDGIDFTVSEDTLLDPGERVLVVLDIELSIQGRVIGAFANDTRLNNAGETLTLTDASGDVIVTVTYDDEAPWPTLADGQGRSLIWTGESDAEIPGLPAQTMAAVPAWPKTQQAIR